MKRFMLLLAALALPLLSQGSRGRGAEEARGWQENARAIHARFAGKRGTLAQFGDSITVTQAFWSPLLQERKNAPPAMEAAFRKVRARLAPECWRDWKGPEFGSEGGQTSRWAQEHIAGWLKKLNPEIALIMFGSNDLHQMEAEEYGNRMRAVVEACLQNGTVVILSTIPPRHGFEEKSARFAAFVRELAREKRLPLVDYHAEILKRRPNDWNGALEKFAAYQDYEAPTLIARDGVHPSYPQKYQNDYSEEALRSNGYGLRSYLTLLKVAGVMAALEAPKRTGQAGAENAQAALPDRAWFPKAPPLPPPAGKVTRVADAAALYRAVERAEPGETIFVAEGTYALPRPLDIRTDRVALRGASGRREKVILDGGNQGELIRLWACSGVTIADLTVQNVKWNGIKLNSETGVQNAVIHNCVLRNIWQRAVKGTLVPAAEREKLRPKNCRVQRCLFFNDRPKRFEDDEADTAQTFNGNYIGGIDVMYPRDWIIRDNVFVGIRGRTGEARGAVFLWHEAEGCVVERNVIIDCDSGICLGNSSRNAETRVHATRCLVRNNFLTRAPENGILADYTQDCRILHNTIYDPESRQGRLIRIVHDNDGLTVANNLLCGPDIRLESESRIALRNNLAKDIGSALAAPQEGNLRLTERAKEAINAAEPLPDAREDIDRRARGSKPDIGAHELP